MRVTKLAVHILLYTDLLVPHFMCASGDCTNCGVFKGHVMELASTMHVTYCFFSEHIKCTEHGPAYIKHYNKQPKFSCKKCSKMTDEQKKAMRKPPRIQKKRLCSKHVMAMNKFMGPDGPNAKQCKKMLMHKTIVKLLGNSNVQRKKQRWKIRLEHWSFNVIMLRNGHPWHQMDRYSLNTMAKILVSCWKDQ